MSPSTVTLTEMEGIHKGKEYVFDAPTRCLIGRASDCDIQLPGYCNPDVSRRHCLLDIDPPTIRLVDLASRNGTFVNGVRLEPRLDATLEELDDPDVKAERDLKDGDEILIGHIVLRVGVSSRVEVLEPLMFL